MARSFRTVRKNTIKIAEEIPEDKYSFPPAEDCRSVGETLVHIAIMSRVPEQVHLVEHRSTLVGFDFFGLRGKLQAEAKAPRTKAQILELLRTEGEKYAKALEGVSEAFLGEQVEYPEGMEPRAKSRFEMLIAAKEHEMHHRGQLMVVQRLLGITAHLRRQMEEVIAAVQARWWSSKLWGGPVSCAVRSTAVERRVSSTPTKTHGHGVLPGIMATTSRKSRGGQTPGSGRLQPSAKDSA